MEIVTRINSHLFVALKAIQGAVPQAVPALPLTLLTKKSIRASKTMSDIRSTASQGCFFLPPHPKHTSLP